MMKSAVFGALSAVICALFLFGCSSPQDRAYEAQENIHEERLELVSEYQDCVEEADGDKVKIETCEQYLKASKALE